MTAQALLNPTPSLRLDHAEDDGLRHHLRSHWSQEELISLLQHHDLEMVHSAAGGLGLIGEPEACPALVRLLHHDDYFLVVTAERALWNIWFRSSSENCCNRLTAAMAEMHDRNYATAEEMLESILDEDDRFAEAYNQRAILRFFTNRFELSLMDCFKVRAMNPLHFGAAAGIGHNLLRVGRYDAAIDAYRRVLRIHPRMEGVRQYLRQARELVNLGNI